MVSLVVNLGLLEVAADATVVDEPARAVLTLRLLFLGLEHVVTLFAKAHASESSHLEGLRVSLLTMKEN